MNGILEYADYVFCNEDEARVFAEINKIEYTTFMDVAVAISKWKKVNSARPRVAIITQGKEPVLLAIHKDGDDSVAKEFPVALLEKD